MLIKSKFLLIHLIFTFFTCPQFSSIQIFKCLTIETFLNDLRIGFIVAFNLQMKNYDIENYVTLTFLSFVETFEIDFHKMV